MGICMYSPLLDEHANSVRGVQFCTELVKRFSFHNYDNLRHTTRKVNPTRRKDESKAEQVVNLLFSAANGDVSAMRRYYFPIYYCSKFVNVNSNWCLLGTGWKVWTCRSEIMTVVQLYIQLQLKEEKLACSSFWKNVVSVIYLETGKV